MPSAVAATVADRTPFAAAVFSVRARAEPGVMPRVLELFAKRGLVPDRWHSAVGGNRRDELVIEIEMAGLAAETIDYLAACLRQITYVEAVLTA